MSRSLATPGTCCGRCGAEIPDGFLCDGCRVFFGSFGQPREGAQRAELPVGPLQVRRLPPRSAWASASCWPEVTVVDHGVSVAVRSNDPRLLDLFLSITASDHGFDRAPAGEYRYSIEALSGKATGPRYFVSADDRNVCIAASRVEALAWLESDLQGKIAAGIAFVHAGVVGWNGAALLLPGATLAGKNAFVMEFLRRGAHPIFDEYVVIDGSGLVRGFPPGLPARALQRPQRVSPAKVLRVSRLNEPLSLDAVLFSKCVRGARPELRQLTPGQAVLALLESTVAPRRNPCGVLRSLKRLAEAVPAFRTQSGELPAPTPILGLLEQFAGRHAPAVMDLEA